MIEELKLKKDENGNRVLFVKVVGHRGFSIQTNGNLPLTHHGINIHTIQEVYKYVEKHGTKQQKALFRRLSSME